MTGLHLFRAATTAALSLTFHINPSMSSSFSPFRKMACNQRNRIKISSIISSFAFPSHSIHESKRVVPSFIHFSQYSTSTDSNKRTSNDKKNNHNNHRLAIGKRSTCRKPPYHVKFAASHNPNDDTTPINIDSNNPSLRTPYTIDDSICPPTDSTKLQECVEKHYNTLNKYLTMKPISKHTLKAFEIADEFVDKFFEENRTKSGIIIDSGCGTARSTIILAQKYPQHVVIGVDRSLVRLNRNAVFRKQTLTTGKNTTNGLNNNPTSSETFFKDDDDDDDDDEEEVNESDADAFINDQTILSQSIPNLPNVLLLRAELSDFWRCILQKKEKDHKGNLPSSNWKIIKHFILYPNPYPKVSRLKSRWYAHPAFPLILNLFDSKEGDFPCEEHDSKLTCNELIVRSNWKVYLSEFATSLTICQTLREKECDDEDVIGQTKSLYQMNGKDTIVEGPYQLKRDNLEKPMTNFEKKFVDWGEAVYELKILI